MRYLIVGMGAAGVSAAETIRATDPKGSITLVGEEAEGYYSRPGLAYVLTREIPVGQLPPFSEQDFERLKIKRVHGRAVKIDAQNQRVTLERGTQIVYDRLLIATGAKARRASVPGADLEGVIKLDEIADTRHILKLCRRARAAVVVGGGITALEIVEGLCAQGIETHYFLRRDRYWGSVLDETESRIVEHQLKEEGVHIHYRTELAEIIGKRGGIFGRGAMRIANVRTKAGQTIKCELVGIAIGVIPRTTLVDGTDIVKDRGILVDEYMQTNIPNIYAAGDVAQAYDPFSGKAVLDILWGTAQNQGRVAGLNMAGQRTAYEKKIPFNVTRLGGLTTTIIGAVGAGEEDDDMVGIVRGDSETWRELPDAIASQSNFHVNRIRVMVGAKTLLGAIVMGDQTLSQPLQRLIAGQVDITPIRTQLLAPNAPLADILAEFWRVCLQKR